MSYTGNAMLPLKKDTVVGLFLALSLLVLVVAFPPLIPGLGVAAAAWLIWRALKRLGSGR